MLYMYAILVIVYDVHAILEIVYAVHVFNSSNSL